MAEPEEHFSTVGEIRTMVALKVSETAIEKMLPEGWEPAPLSIAASKGANLRLGFTDQIVATDADGKPMSATPFVPLVIPARAKGTDQTQIMAVRTFAPAGRDAYGINIPARSTIERNARTDASGACSVQEHWRFVTDEGDHLELQLEYVRGKPVRNEIEYRVYSGTRPDFYRTYRIELAEDVVRSVPAGIDRVQTCLLKASGRRLSELFDGTEQVVSITSLPYCRREIHVPRRFAVVRVERLSTEDQCR